jgi:protein SDA1
MVAVSQTGGLSNKQKQHGKSLLLQLEPRQHVLGKEKKLQRRRSGNQFRGRKAWK